MIWENRSEKSEKIYKMIFTKGPQINKGVSLVSSALCGTTGGHVWVEAFHLPLIDDPITPSESMLFLVVVWCSPTAGVDSFWCSFSFVSKLLFHKWFVSYNVT